MQRKVFGGLKQSTFLSFEILGSGYIFFIKNDIKKKTPTKKKKILNKTNNIFLKNILPK